jgi:hybrid cluster-associated redox disulfide protein
MADLMAADPRMVTLLLKRGMSCVGCCMAAFDTIADAATEHGIDLADLLAELRAAQTS